MKRANLIKVSLLVQLRSKLFMYAVFKIAGRDLLKSDIYPRSCIFSGQNFTVVASSQRRSGKKKSHGLFIGQPSFGVDIGNLLQLC